MPAIIGLMQRVSFHLGSIYIKINEPQIGTQWKTRSVIFLVRYRFFCHLGLCSIGVHLLGANCFECINAF